MILINKELEKLDIRFKIYNNIIYYVFSDDRERLCIFYFIKKKIFYITYNLSNYNEFYKNYNQFSRFIYI